MELFDSIVSAGSAAFDYIGENEWAANALGGAAGAAGAYMMQEDEQAHERDLLREKRSYDVNISNVAPGEMDMSNYGAGLTKNGMLTNGLLTKNKG